MIVIVGAGPVGLYFLNKLLQAGINREEVVIYDPRVGDYIRPGQFHVNVFKKIEEGLGKPFQHVEDKPFGDIKALERTLHQMASSSGARIEKKRFVRLHENADKSGVIVADSEGTEEFVAADVVFDCSGQRQIVLESVNQICPDSQLKREKFMDFSNPHLFLANVHISSNQLHTLYTNVLTYEGFINAMDPLVFAHSLVKLRDLGWNEPQLPLCYAIPCGKDGSNKACLYLKAPKFLEQKNYDAWVQTVLDCYIGSAQFDHLKPTKKHDKSKDKLRFTPFTLNSEALREVAYQGQDLPTVVALGDAQIGFDPELGHGLYDGVVGVDILFNHLQIVEGKISHLDWQNYALAIKDHLQQHKKAMIENEKKRRAFEGFETAKNKLLKAIAQSHDEQEKLTFNELLYEIVARKSYAVVCKLHAECQDLADKVKTAPLLTDLLLSKLNTLDGQLLKVRSEIPVSMDKERDNCASLMLSLAEIFTVVGKEALASSKKEQADQAFQKALKIYSVPEFKEKCGVKEVAIYSDLITLRLEKRQYIEVINLAQYALNRSMEFPEFHEKIVFNYITAMCAQIQEDLSLGNHENAATLYKRVKQFNETHQHEMKSPFALDAMVLVIEVAKQYQRSLENLRTKQSSWLSWGISFFDLTPREEEVLSRAPVSASSR